ncbi:hypothetical protein [Microbacterium halophytorum]|uniref:hypothetical protein n=1 Tax=Microbacterium halophytorum TaxID=2067568 RepID=UPI000CFB685E|nr:hypothetical protein [Microbacterium halophytorum]
MVAAEFVVTHPGLRTAYSRATSSVAFVDESYRAAGRPGEPPFYLMVAVVIDVDAMGQARADLMRIAGGTYWHTTEAFRELTGRSRVDAMVAYLSAADVWSVVAVQTCVDPRDATLESARMECMARLIAEVTRGGGPHATRTIVAEIRRPGAEQARDDENITRLFRAGVLSDGVRLHMVSPNQEPLLWAPDVVAWALRRLLALGDGQWFSPLRTACTLFESGSGRRIMVGVPRAGR